MKRWVVRYAPWTLVVGAAALVGVGATGAVAGGSHTKRVVVEGSDYVVPRQVTQLHHVAGAAVAVPGERVLSGGSASTDAASGSRSTGAVVIDGGGQSYAAPAQAHGPYWFGPVSPQWVKIPRFGVQARVVPVDEASDGSMGVPENAKIAGWWDRGSRPGDAWGTAVLDSHVATRSSGTGAFYHLADMRRGDEVVVGGPEGVVHFVVRQVIEIPRDSDPSPYFDPDVPSRLVLITCGGSWDPSIGHHRDNIVVIADPLR